MNPLPTFPLTRASSPEAFVNWLNGLDSGARDEALIGIHEDIASRIGNDDDCRHILEEIVLPPIENIKGISPGFPIAFRLLRARLLEDGEAAFERVIKEADNMGLTSLAVRGVMEWALWRLGKGYFQGADHLFERAGILYRALGMPLEAELALISRSRLAARLHGSNKAAEQIREWLDQSLTAETAGRLHLELALCLLSRGEIMSADDHLCRAEILLKDLPDPKGRILAQQNRAGWFFHLGAYDRAYLLFTRARDQFEKEGRIDDAAVAEANRCIVCIALNMHLSEAVDRLVLLRNHLWRHDPLLWWQMTMGLAAGYEKTGDFTLAAAMYGELRQVGGLKEWETKLAGLNLAHLRLSARINVYLEEDIAAALEDPVVRTSDYLRFLALENAGDMEVWKQHPPKAVYYYRLALDCLENTRESLPWEFLRRRIRQSRFRVFSRLETILLELGAPEEAWQVADQAKGQSFIDFLSGGSPEIDRRELDAFHRLRADLSGAYIFDFQSADAFGENDRAEGETPETHRLELLLDWRLTEMRRSYSSDRMERTWRDWPALLNSKTALLHFGQSGHGFGAYLVREGRVHYQRLLPNGDGSDLFDRVGAWWRRHRPASRQPVREDEWKKETASWSEVFLSGLTDRLEGVETLMIVPDGSLSLTPWAGLWNPLLGEYWGEIFTRGICVIPGSRFGRLMDERGRMEIKGNPLIVHPPSGLIFTGLEARLIRDIQGSNCIILAGEEADLSNLYKYLPNCSWFHFAGHGKYRPELPMASHLELSGGQRWTGWDMSVLALPPSMVVLSACEIGTIKELEVGEWFGLLRGFLLSGARNILAPLGETPDLGTAAFMYLFYRHVWKEGLSPIRALARSQAELRLLGMRAGRNGGQGENAETVGGDSRESGVPSADEGCNPVDDEQLISFLNLALDHWRRSDPRGRYANEIQVRNKKREWVHELALMGHPRNWSLFQLFGGPGPMEEEFDEISN